MQVRADQLAAHLQRGLAPLYTVHGDEPLLALEAADAIRAAARAAGHTEREVHTVAGAHVDWSGILGGAQAMSLFADKRLIEIRIPSGKPGKDGSAALQAHAARLPEDTLTLVSLPRLDRMQMNSAWFGALEAAGVVVKVEPVGRAALPAWLARRLAAQGQHVAPGPEGEQALARFADRVEGNLMAAAQEIRKLALLHPPGTLSAAQIEAAVLPVARYDIFKLGEALLGGQVARLRRMLAGLEAEGEAAVLVHWAIADDIRALRRCRLALDAGQPLAAVLREQRIWGPKEALYERALPRLDAARLDAALADAHRCDGIVKGLPQPGWPASPWAALEQLALSLALPLAAPARAAAPRRG